MVKAVLLNSLNPKLTIFFLAVLPQFVDDCAAAVDWTRYRVVGFSSLFQQNVASLALVALLAAAAVLAVAQNAPVFAALFVAELCRPSAEVWLLLMAVTSCTWIVARLVVRHRPKQLPDMVRRRP